MSKKLAEEADGEACPGLDVLLSELSDLRRALEATRGLLYRIDTFSITLVSGLVIAISVYHIDLLVLVAPLVVYLTGFMWSSESIRLLKLREHIRVFEVAVRGRVQKGEGQALPEGFETAARGRSGFLFLLRHENIMAATAFLYGAFWALFMFLLGTSSYSLTTRFSFLGFYVVFCPVLWAYDTWNNRRFLVSRW